MGNMNSQQLVSIAMLVGMLILMYLLLIRPQKKQEKIVNEMRNSLQVGDDILTIGGFFGRIVKIKDEVITLQLAGDGTKVEVAKWAISKKAEPSDRKVSEPAAKSQKTDKQSAPEKKASTNTARPKELKKPVKEDEPETASSVNAPDGE